MYNPKWSTIAMVNYGRLLVNYKPNSYGVTIIEIAYNSK
jgi:hypothetical protein